VAHSHRSGIETGIAFPAAICVQKDLAIAANHAALVVFDAEGFLATTYSSHAEVWQWLVERLSTGCGVHPSRACGCTWLSGTLETRVAQDVQI